MNKIWSTKKSDVSIIKKLAQDLNVSEIISELLVQRGIKNFDEARLFFRPKISDLHDPFLMKNMSVAVKRIESAISRKEGVLIYGDYDVDGTTSVAMMYSFLKKYITDLEYYIPCRYQEGYGISLDGIDYAQAKNISLIIALDCGTRAIKQINYANKRGIDFIICDHHLPSDKIPSPIALLNPKQADCCYPYKELSGCGVGFKLLQAYCLSNKIPFDTIKQYLDLLAVSISADLVPMTGENRVLTFYGLKQINSNPREGLRALMDDKTKVKKLTTSDLAFRIAPRINAAGRIEHAKKAVEILIEKNRDKATFFSESIEENNKTRKELDQSITKEALQMIDQNKKSTVVYSDKWHKGVLGIVASRLIETHYKPTIVLAESDGIFTGSARSVHGFDLYEAISKCSYLCEKFGGHKYAAGLSIKKENLDAFIKAFEIAVNEKITDDQLSPKIDVDLEISIDSIDKKLFRILKQFSPFGPLNLPPVFISKGVRDTGYGKKIGADNQHLRITIKDSDKSISAIGFGLGDFLDTINENQRFDICYSIEENHWNGKTSLQLIIHDIKN